VEILKTFEEKFAYALEKAKAMKEEKVALEKKIDELESLIRIKDQEIEKLGSEKSAVKNQIESLLNELEAVNL
jgi:uncharacterized 2Fe-2S/4Fe-4S cluster protein (DUF4445 family)